MDSVSWAMEVASKYGLQAEVVYTAFQHKTFNPNASIEECFAVGLEEWDL